MLNPNSPARPVNSVTRAQCIGTWKLAYVALKVKGGPGQADCFVETDQCQGILVYGADGRVTVSVAGLFEGIDSPIKGYGFRPGSPPVETEFHINQLLGYTGTFHLDAQGNMHHVIDASVNADEVKSQLQRDQQRGCVLLPDGKLQLTVPAQLMPPGSRWVWERVRGTITPAQMATP